MATSVVIKGLDKLARKNSAVAPAFKRGLKAGGGHIEQTIKVYPRTTLANSPTQKRWYERGWGPKWRLRGGGWHGIKSSEQLNRSWTVKVKNNGSVVIVGTDTSYAPYVHSIEKQAAALKGIGWKTDEQVLDEELPTVERFLLNEVNKALNTP